MAKYRTAVLLAEESLGTSGTKTVDVTIGDPISAFTFGFRVTVAAAARLAPEADVFSKIELVDGSDVLMSLSGSELLALGFYEGHKLIDCDCGNLTTDTVEGWLRVNFGRKLWDPLLALDPKKFRNLQIKATFNAATIMVGATPLYMRILAECFDEKAISPMGFLRHTEFKSYTPVTTTYSYTDLPTDQVIRKLYLQTKYFGSAHTQLLGNARLDEDNQKRIPFDLTSKEWMDKCIQDFGRCHQYLGAYGSGASYPCFGAPCNVENFNVMNASAQNAIQAVTGTGGKFAFATSTSTQVLIGEVSGSLPFFVYCYPFGDQDDPDDWYDATKVGSLRLRTYGGSSVSGSALENVILQQLRKY